MSDNKALYTVKQVAERLQVHPQTVYRLCWDRKLESVVLGSRTRRITAASLEKYVETLTVPVRGGRRTT